MNLKNYFKHAFLKGNVFEHVGERKISLWRTCFIMLNASFFMALISGSAFATDLHKLVMPTANHNFVYEKYNAANINAPIRVSGQVVDTSDMPLQGVSITIVGTRTSTITNSGGYFNIDVDPGKKLHFSFLGFESKIIPIAEDTKSLKITLEGSSTQLAGVTVVATGYQTLNKEKATGSFSTISNKKLETKKEGSIITRMEGMIPGMVKTSKGIPTLRGVSTLQGNKRPLYVVDGMPYEGDINDITPGEVASITVLKDASAAAIYGVRSNNGVIVITTKKGKEGKTRVSYSTTLNIRPLTDISYLRQLSGPDYIKLVKEEFDYDHTKESDLNRREHLNELQKLFYDHAAKRKTDAELNAEMARLGAIDGREDIKNALLQTAFDHQHDLSISGGTNVNTYRATLSYIGGVGNVKGDNNSQIRIGIENDFKFFEWLSADLGFNVNYSKSQSKDIPDVNSANVPNNAMNTYLNTERYKTLRDKKGVPSVWYLRKSQKEIDRLNGLGLMDQTYRPLDEFDGKYNKTIKTNYYRIQAGLNFKLHEDLNFDAKYQSEINTVKNSLLFSENSLYVRSMINDAVVVEKGKEHVYNIPLGAQYKEIVGQNNSYTLRAQFNYKSSFSDMHSIMGILGTEVRSVSTQGTGIYRFGYNANSLTFKPIDIYKLRTLKGTEMVNKAGDRIEYEDKNNNFFIDVNDRFVSYYGNGTYMYNNRYALNGSLRYDLSNLFGSDPKYKYIPLWSLGAAWFVKQEEFMREVYWLDRLNLRLTYGFNGNIGRDNDPTATIRSMDNMRNGPEEMTFTGPYMILRDLGVDELTLKDNMQINTPPNYLLRPEKTSVVNLGIDFSLFSGRVEGSIDIYSKKTKDILGTRSIDPTYGFSSNTENYAGVTNKGVELSLNTLNFYTKKIQWSTDLTFGYNKNTLTDIVTYGNSIVQYVQDPYNVIGKPMYSLFSYKYAGLSKDGLPLVYDIDGKPTSAEVKNETALVYSGPTIAPYSATLNNRLSFYNVNLSFLFVYYGGHVFRDEVANFGGGVGPGSSVLEKNRWRKVGDEANKEIAPRLLKASEAQEALSDPAYTLKWYSADIHVQPADYIKLRNISLSYDLPAQWLRPIKMQSLNVSFQLSNVWTWVANKSGTDPEATITGRNGTFRTQLAPMVYTLGLTGNF